MRGVLSIFLILSFFEIYAQSETELPTDEEHLLQRVRQADDLVARLRFQEVASLHESMVELATSLYGREDIRTLRNESRYMFTHMGGDSIEVVEKFADLAERLYRNSETTAHDLAYLQYLRGNFSNKSGNSTDALALYQTANNLWESDPHEADLPFAVPSYQLGVILTNSGSIQMDRGQLAEAEVAMKAARKIFEQHELPEFYAIVSGNLAVLYERQMKYQTAVDINLSVLPNFDRADPDNEYLNTIYNNLGQAYARIGNFREARKYHERALQNCADPNLNIDEESICKPALGYLGFVEEKQKNYSEALRLYRAALPAGTTHDRAVGLHQIGLIYQKEKKYEEALDYFQQAKVTYAAYYGNVRHHTVAQIEESIGNLYSVMKKYAAARTHLESAEEILKFDRNSKNFTQVASTSTLLSVLISRAENEWLNYGESPRKEYLLRGMEEIRLADAMISELKTRMIDRSSRADFRKQWRSAYMTGLDLSYHLYRTTGDEQYLEQGYYFAEKQHHELLLSGIRENEARFQAGIPREIQEEERSLQARIIYAEKNLYEELSYGTQAYQHKLDDYRRELAIARREYDNFVRSLEENFPEYYQLKYDPQTATLAQAREILLPGQAQLVYAEGSDKLYAIVVGAETSRFIELNDRKGLKDRINTYFDELIATPRRAGAGRDQQLGHELYRELFQPIEALFVERIVIIPTGMLGQLPFEALSRTPSGPPDYLLDHHVISYGYSATLLRQTYLSPQRTYEESGIMGFAPDYGTGKEIMAWLEDSDNRRVNKAMDQNPLRYNKREVRLLTDAYGGKAMLRNQATEANFLKMAGRYPIVHLAVHGVADLQQGQYSHLVFAYRKKMAEEQHKLYARELYDRMIPAKLVTLSACETGMGQLREGDGIISMSHAFRQSGARSVINSLWLVNDEFTPKLMAEFYRRLATGESKDVALSKAKRSFRAEQNKSYSHPYYWATFVPVGSMAIIDEHLLTQQNSIEFNWMFFGSIGLFAFGLFLFGLLLRGYLNGKKASRI